VGRVRRAPGGVGVERSPHCSGSGAGCWFRSSCGEGTPRSWWGRRGALPALFGLRGGLLVSIVVWGGYAALLVGSAWSAPRSEAQVGALLYAAVSHLVGFSILAVLGGVLADRLKRTGSELARQREDLDDLRALHADIVASINTGLMTTDEAGIVTFMNRAGRELFGGRAHQVPGRSLCDTFGFPANFLETTRRQIETGRRHRFEKRCRITPDGPGRLFGFSVSALETSGGQSRGWLLVFQDLTEIASLEEQVRVSERMAALGEMAAGMAHELRNPLTAICGCVQVLETRVDSEESCRLKDVVLREAERLNTTLREFLAFARPSPHRPRPCAVGELMAQMARLLQKSPEFKRTHEVCVEATQDGILARVDLDAMKQVFWNLASNALRAMPEGGRLEISIEDHGVDEVLVVFRDQGCGMDSEAMKRYFQPFGSRFEGGTGLGAAIVYRIVEEHGGRIQLVSREGHGTEIRLILPAAEAAAEAGPRPEPAYAGPAAD
jgi:two-component system, NtrC family, sensor histidine kinase PilS